MAGTFRDELWAWKGISEKRKYADIIPITILWAVWNERNVAAFEEVDEENSFDFIIKNRWLPPLSFCY